MCGIAGIWGETDTEKVRKMVDAVEHRGPDSTGLHEFGDSGVLGHARLAIIGIDNGLQPIASEDEKSAIVANGEVYNWKALKAGLQGAHNFRTRSDSEVPLHLVEEYGLKALPKLDGMFAFAVASDDSLLLVRDPIGIKPLYYMKNPDGSVEFASEMKAFTNPSREIQELPPGSYYNPHTGVKRYFKLADAACEVRDTEAWIAALRGMLERAVEKWSMSDTPIGVFLSGGLDSSLVAAMAIRRFGPLPTFSVGFEGSPDLLAARKVAEHIGSIHHEYILTEEEIKAHLPEIVYHLESFDADLIRSAVPCYFCSKLAAEHVKVVLTGEGADELFAGYTYYKEIDDGMDLQRELRRSVGGLYNINLQRVDRMTMAHGLEARVPLLDSELIEMALRLPPELKMYVDPAQGKIEKWVLRKAVEDLLPQELVWRKKLQFDQGSGSADRLPHLVKAMAEGIEMDKPGLPSRLDIRSEEERLYFKMFSEVFRHPEAMLSCVGRWELQQNSVPVA